MLNTGRLAKCIQDHAEEADAAQQADCRRLDQRLSAVEAGTAAAPRREHWQAQHQALQVLSDHGNQFGQYPTDPARSRWQATSTPSKQIAG